MAKVVDCVIRSTRHAGLSGFQRRGKVRRLPDPDLCWQACWFSWTHFGVVLRVGFPTPDGCCLLCFWSVGHPRQRGSFNVYNHQDGNALKNCRIKTVVLNRHISRVMNNVWRRLPTSWAGHASWRGAWRSCEHGRHHLHCLRRVNTGSLTWKNENERVGIFCFI